MLFVVLKAISNAPSIYGDIRLPHASCIKHLNIIKRLKMQKYVIASENYTKTVCQGLAIPENYNSSTMVTNHNGADKKMLEVSRRAHSNFQ